MASNHLDNLTIHKFRGLRDLELKDLGQVNLLVGENNCGKTSVLEAINLYCNPLDIKSWVDVARHREAAGYSLSLVDALEWLFVNDLLLSSKGINTGDLLIQGSGKFIVRKIFASYKEISEILITGENNNQLIESESEDLLDERSHGFRYGIELTIELEAGDSLQIEKLQSFDIKIKLWEGESLSTEILKDAESDYNLPVLMITLHAGRGLLKSFSEARFAGLVPEIRELLSKLDPNIMNLEILHGSRRPESVNQAKLGLSLYIQHAKLGLSPISTFGDGVRRLLYMALNIAQVKNGIVLIDEIESAIHTEFLQEAFLWIVKLAKELNVQVFATTHSLEAIDAMVDAADSASDLVLYRLEPTETKTRVVRHDWERLKRLRENLGQEVR